MKAGLRLLSPLGIGVLLTILSQFTLGCATVVNGPDQRVSITSNPTNATVQIDGTGSYKTPTQVKLSRKKEHVLVFTKDGYEQQNVVVMHVISGAVAGNILLGGLIGWGVDAITGAQYRLVPESVNVELKPIAAEGALAQIPVMPIKEVAVDERLKRLDELYREKLISETEYKAMRMIILQGITGSQAAGQTPLVSMPAVETQPKIEVKSEVDTKPQVVTQGH